MRRRASRLRRGMSKPLPSADPSSTTYHSVFCVVSHSRKVSFQSIVPSPITEPAGPPCSLRCTERARPGNLRRVAIGSPPPLAQLPLSSCMITSDACPSRTAVSHAISPSTRRKVEAVGVVADEHPDPLSRSAAAGRGCRRDSRMPCGRGHALPCPTRR